jgi:type I restriction enzyme S subunit
VDKEILENITVFCPSDEQQRKIAEVLDTLDTTIHQTGAIVEKLKRVKQGLLHDLLTRGVDANGELRSSYEEAAELYQESPCGLIPKTWRSLGLAEFQPETRSVIRTGPFGSSLKGEHWRDSGRAVVTIGSLGIGKFIDDELLFVDEFTARRLSEYELISGDIAFSRVADVGRSVVVNEAQEGWIMSSNFMRISVNKSKVQPDYLQLLLAHSAGVRKQMRATVNSGGRDVANSAILMGLRFPIPTPHEQCEIVNRNAALGLRLEEESGELEKLLKVKTGLMDDLLTGRVRVTPLLAQ